MLNVILGAIALGLLIGLSLGALGGGGSILTVPALVYILSLPARQATTASLVIVGVTAAAASIGHARSGHTRWGSGFLLTAVGVPASLLGTLLNRRVQPNVLLLSFAALMLIAAAAMLVRAGGARAAESAGLRAPEGEQTRGGDTLTVTRQRTRTEVGTRSRSRSGQAVRLGAAGLGIGFLTGFLGVGGGFIVVPALVVLLGTPMPVAVGTSLLVISLNSAVALAARAGNGSFDWKVIVPFTAAAVAGSLGGKRVADRVNPHKLTVAFAVLLVAVAVYVAVQAGLGVT
ncbi:MAG: sulfite exporter TauE/SafE family protein [Mycobacteriales bacterium]